MSTHGGLHWTNWVQDYMDGCDNPDFNDYRDDFNATDERFQWLVYHLAELGQFHNGRILDIGCGFGWDAAALSLAANTTVVANDIRREMTSVVEQRSAAIRNSGADIKIETLTCDVCQIDLPPSSFDGIISDEAIEHIHDLDALFKVCFRLLKPGRRAIFINDSNALNRALVKETEAYWKRRDADPQLIEEIKKTRPIENRDIQPYRLMRQEIIQRANPKLDPASVHRIATATAGMAADEIEPIARTYKPGMNLPTPPRLSWCRNPVTKEYCERLLDPFEVAEQLVANGFSAKVRHGFRKWPLNMLNGIGLRWLNEALFNYRPFFIVVAIKPSVELP